MIPRHPAPSSVPTVSTPKGFARRLLRACPRLLRPILVLGMAASTFAALPDEPTLHRASLRLEPTRQQVATIVIPPAAWHLTPSLHARFETLLTAGDFPPALQSALRSALRPLPGAEDGLIIPDAALLDAFAPGDRVRWWAILARHPENRAYRWPVAFPAQRLAELAQNPRFTAACTRLRAWCVPEADHLLFADWFALRELLPDEPDRIDLIAQLLAVDTLFAKTATNAVPAPHLTYWQGGGRSRSVDSILSSTRRLDGYEKLDLAHLLPRLPRALLHTFPPDLSVLDEPNVENAVAAVTFFQPHADAQTELAEGFGPWLRRHCEPVTGPRQFGDIVVFEDPSAPRWPFALVHVADDLLFGRRPGLFGPWELLPIATVPRLNPHLRGRSVTTYRIRQEPAPAPDEILQRESGPAVQLQPLAAGPWGRLHAYPVRLAPSLELLAQLPAPSATPTWTFAGLSPARIQQTLAQLDLAPRLRTELRTLFESARPDRQGRITVRPSLPLVLATPAEVRAALFPYLVPGSVATDYAQDVSLPIRSSPAAWIDQLALDPPWRDVLQAITYRRGEGLALADFGALYHAADDERQRRAALQAVFQTPVLIVLLERPLPTEVPALAAYWRYDQQKRLRPLLHSFAENTEFAFLDIIHLLPPLARETMNVFMRATADTPTPSCYWTALNFAAERPDPRLLVNPRSPGDERTEVERRLREDYQPGAVPTQLGDLIVYRRLRDGEPLHLCAFVAADIVFTKNGFGSNNPWCLMRLADVDALYLEPGVSERLTYQRREN